VLTLPAPSVKLHVTVVLLVTGKTVAVVPVIVPLQLSVVVGAVGFTVHAALISDKTGAMGASMSTVVIVEVHVLMLPDPSVTSRVTITGGLLSSKQSKSVWSPKAKAKLTMPPQLSNDPLSTSEGTMLPVPKLSSWTVTSWHCATGGTLSLMMIF